MEDNLVAIGKVLKPHGVRGEIKAMILSDFPERFEETDEVWLVSPDGKQEKHAVESARFHSGCVLLCLSDIYTPEEVKDLAGWLISVPDDSLVELEEGEYWHFQLEGLTVNDENGQLIGTFKEVIETPGHDIYAVLTPQGKEVLIPAVAQYVLNVDLANKTMTCRNPEL